MKTKCQCLSHIHHISETYLHATVLFWWSLHNVLKCSYAEPGLDICANDLEHLLRDVLVLGLTIESKYIKDCDRLRPKDVMAIINGAEQTWA